MPTNAEIKALINTRVRAQRSHILNNGVAEILDFIVDNISAGPGGTPGINSVLAQAQALTADRGINIAGFELGVYSGDQQLGLISLSESYIKSFNATGEGQFQTEAEADHVTADVIANFNDGVKLVQIRAFANATTATLTHTADTHEFIGRVLGVGIDDVLAQDQLLTAERELHLNGHIYQIESILGQYPLHVDPVGLQTYIQASDGNMKTKLHLYGGTDGTNAAFFLTSYDGINEIGIVGDAAAETIVHEAANGHTFVGDIIIDGLAGGGTTGLSIDNDGKIIRTP